MAERVFIAVGSNLGDRARNCLKAIGLIEENSGRVRLVRKSPFYETEPWGLTEQPPFVNAVIEVATGLEPRPLLAFLKGIEEEMGREGAARWGPRRIDLDIIFFGRRVLRERGLVIPHPRMNERAFVLVPLADIAPGFIHPVFKKTVTAMKGALKDTGSVKRLAGQNN
ncbi:MAG: 2-amino-4-hydroxy-6-hydroxymethyldihydropteridine diphosphokinase [Thermodesulfobacteriota bacterium]